MEHHDDLRITNGVDGFAPQWCPQTDITSPLTHQLSSQKRSSSLSNPSFNMAVTRLELELRYQGKKLRGVTWKLTRSEHGFLPESSWLIAAQVIVPFLVSGLGMVSAGIVMDLIQVWKDLFYLIKLCDVV